MLRDYDLMRDILLVIKDEGPTDYADIVKRSSQEIVSCEVKHLSDSKLVKSTVRFTDRGTCIGGTIESLTQEGSEFLKLIENPSVWRIVAETLKGAKVDISYPLLKEVCEEIVERYVVSFIPEIKH